MSSSNQTNSQKHFFCFFNFGAYRDPNQTWAQLLKEFGEIYIFSDRAYPGRVYRTYLLFFPTKKLILWKNETMFKMFKILVLPITVSRDIFVLAQVLFLSDVSCGCTVTSH